MYIRHCQESNSQPVPSQVGADPTRLQWRIYNPLNRHTFCWAHIQDDPPLYLVSYVSIWNDIIVQFCHNRSYTYTYGMSPNSIMPIAIFSAHHKLNRSSCQAAPFDKFILISKSAVNKINVRAAGYHETCYLFRGGASGGGGGGNGIYPHQSF